MIILCCSYLGNIMQVLPGASVTNGDQDTLRYALDNFAHLLEKSIQGISYDGADWIAAIQAAYDCVNVPQNAEVIRVLTHYHTQPWLIASGHMQEHLRAQARRQLQPA